MTIEGIPDGWELVRIGNVRHGEYYLDAKGHPVMWTSAITSHQTNYIIIRKIEKQKQYRAFANAAEADCLWNAVLKPANLANGGEDFRYRINSIAEDGATIGLQFFDYRQAFEVFVCTDGTPFGVEVTE